LILFLSDSTEKTLQFPQREKRVHFLWILFVPHVAVDALAGEGLVRYLPFHVFGLIAFGAFHFFFPNL